MPAEYWKKNTFIEPIRFLRVIDDLPSAIDRITISFSFNKNLSLSGWTFSGIFKK